MESDYNLYSAIKGMLCAPEDLSEEIHNVITGRAEFLLQKGLSPDAVMRQLSKECSSPSGDASVSRGRIVMAVAAGLNSIKSVIRSDLAGQVVLSGNNGWSPIITEPEKHLSALKTEVQSWCDLEGCGFGISELDKAYGGLFPGETLALVGAPGSMKTSLAISAAESFLRHGSDGKVLFFSLDMPARTIAARRLMREMDCFQSQLYEMIKSGSPELDNAIKRLHEYDRGRFRIADKPRGGSHFSWEQITGIVSQLAPELVIIDYLTLIGDYRSELEAVKDLMPKIVGMAGDFGLSVILLSQMGRVSRAAQKTSLGAHAAGGHYVEDAVDVEIELLQEKDSNDENAIIATITKTRKGRSGQSFRLDFKPRSLSFGHTCLPVNKAKAPQKIFDV